MQPTEIQKQDSKFMESVLSLYVVHLLKEEFGDINYGFMDDYMFAYVSVKQELRDLGMLANNNLTATGVAWARENIPAEQVEVFLVKYRKRHNFHKAMQEELWKVREELNAYWDKVKPANSPYSFVSFFYTYRDNDFTAELDNEDYIEVDADGANFVTFNESSDAISYPLPFLKALVQFGEYFHMKLGHLCYKPADL